MERGSDSNRRPWGYESALGILHFVTSSHTTLTFITSLSLTELARTICELLEWKRPNGRLKKHECRLLLEKLSVADLVNPPPLRVSGPRGPRVVVPTENGAEREPVTGSAGELAPLTLTVVRSGPESALWNEFVARYHYLGYKVPVGANLRYLVRSGSAKQVLACLLWSSPAWKMAARDSWIRWTDEERSRKLQLIVNNSRFLILPWVRVRYLASTILSLCAAPTGWGLGTPLRLSPAAFGDAR